MADAQISQIEVNGTTYDICDAEARDSLDKKPELDAIYPVGSIYMSVVSTSPAILFGGTWERITGRFLLSATDSGNSGASQAAGNTGGVATVTLTSAQSGNQAQTVTSGAGSKHTHGLSSHTHTLSSHTHTTTIDHGHSFTQPKVALAAHTHFTTGDSTEQRYIIGKVEGATISVGRTQVATSTSSGKYAPTTTASTVNYSAATYTGNPGAHTTTATGGAVTNYTGSKTSGGPSNNTSGTPSNNTSGEESKHTHSVTIAAKNATSAHDNMPPYLAVYVWKRTA